MGTIGSKIFPIEEDDLVQYMMKKVGANTSGDFMKKFTAEMTKKSEAYVRRPPGTKLPRTVTREGVMFDPSIELSQDIVGADGEVIFPAGTRVNPLDYRNLTKSICFVDVDDREQVAWLKRNCPNDFQYTVILTGGDTVDTMKELDRAIYYDQYSKLGTHFGVKSVPTMVRQIDKALYVEAIPVH